MSNSISDLTPNQLRQAAVLKEKIEALQSDLARLLSGSPAPKKAAAKKTAGKPKAKRNISPEGLARIIAAQKRRWANKRKSEGKAPAAKKAAKK